MCRMMREPARLQQPGTGTARKGCVAQTAQLARLGLRAHGLTRLKKLYRSTTARAGNLWRGFKNSETLPAVDMNLWWRTG